ncbi:uncharacterized protein [Montipora capricornis]|uniref:uncharacterized protein n=1 Tax=Montipora capricornis TaxID=246305 RepID=UPI0035F172CC
MGFQLYHAAVFTASLLFAHCAGSSEQSQSTNRSKHDEIHRARSQIDSLIYKLTLDLNTFTETKDHASALEKDAEKLARIAEEEIALLKPVQQLLEKLANGNRDQTSSCFGTRGGKIQVQIEAKESALPKHYTINVPVNHRELIDRGLTRNDGDDLQVYYHDNRQHRVQLDRVIKGLGTKSATVQFRLQAPISANTVDGSSYSLVMGDLVSGSTKDNPEKVYAFYDDFSSSTLKKDWVKTWGQWSVQNGRLLGSTMQTEHLNGDNVEVGVYLKTGFHWKDVEVELDLMEISWLKLAAPGPFLRLSNVNPSNTTGWWIEYFLGTPYISYFRPLTNNKDSAWQYQKMLPTAFQSNKWFHLHYRVMGNKFWQWVNGKLVHSNWKVAKEWKIPAGTLGMGCHRSPHNCKTLYDNIKVTLLVATAPTITLGLLQPLFLPNSALLGDKKLPADSCKQIHDASLVNNTPRAKNGIYWIKTDLQGSSAVQTFCDMKNGGWTLVGKISGKVGNIYEKWLVSNYNTDELKTAKISKHNQFACLDARSLAVEEASTVMLSSGEMTDGLGSKWVMWRLPGDREKTSFWDHSVGLSALKAAVQKPVMVIAWNGNKKTCFQNKFGIMPYTAHGGSYPYASFNTEGNTATNDNCMAVGVMSKGSTAHGWSQNGNGYDSPSSDSDWPNKSYSHQSPYVVVWLK